MKALNLLALAAFALVPVLAQAAAPRGDRDLATSKTPAVFCEGPYALCIKAPCVPVVDSNGVTTAVCSCDVKPGWSMGPASCDARKPVKKNGLTYLMSTYSNFYNTQDKTMSCSNAGQIWAWCYGAPCVVDPREPTKTTCNCPVLHGRMQTLGGTCGTTGGGCNGLWSAARPVNDAFANKYFYDYMKKHHPYYPTNQPAALCSP